MGFKFKIKGMDKVEKQLKTLEKELKAVPNVIVGVDSSANYSNGTPVSDVGAVIEFGSMDGTRPEKSFIRSTANENEKKYKVIADKLIKKAVAKEKEVDMTPLGIIMRRDVKAKLDKNGTVDTGLLKSSIIYEINEE